MNGICEALYFDVVEIHISLNVNTELSLSQPKDKSTLVNRFTDVKGGTPGFTQTTE